MANSTTIRPWRSEDTDELKRITIDVFGGVSIEYYIEQKFGRLGNDWTTRKARDIDDDVRINPTGVFVAEDDAGTILGYITTRVDHESGLGRIPNIAVRAGIKGQGLGKVLMEHALRYFHEQGMTHVKIETLAPNEIGTRFFPQMGFEEVVRQIHYVMRLPGVQSTDAENV